MEPERLESGFLYGRSEVLSLCFPVTYQRIVTIGDTHYVSHGIRGTFVCLLMKRKASVSEAEHDRYSPEPPPPRFLVPGSIDIMGEY